MLKRKWQGDPVCYFCQTAKICFEFAGYDHWVPGGVRGGEGDRQERRFWTAPWEADRSGGRGQQRGRGGEEGLDFRRSFEDRGAPNYGARGRGTFRGRGGSGRGGGPGGRSRTFVEFDRP